MRSPRRTAQTAAALMVGLALVSTIAVIGASLSKSLTSNVNNAVTADYIITSGSVSASVPAVVSRIPGVATVSIVYQGQFELRGSLQTLTAVTPADLPRTVHLALTAGSGAPALTAGELLVDTTTASADHLSVGSVVPVKFTQTGAATIRIGGIFKANQATGSYLTRCRLLSLALQQSAADRDPGQGDPRRQRPRDGPDRPPRGIPEPEDPDPRPVSAVSASPGRLFGLDYVFMALAVLIAGIVNTLMLSVFERTHELGLLRAVGMKRRQVRVMIRSEAVIIALFGAVTGIIIGTALGVAFAVALKQQGVAEIAIPFAELAGFLVLSALLGLGAASWPARRAAKLDVLAAIATE
ncbi:MAG: ABC transporter permease [Solirubrobacteraceae bacterium]|jgi:putative ABC transport system permease protein